MRLDDLHAIYFCIGYFHIVERLPFIPPSNNQARIL
jgi:hypothetical protein